VSKYDNMTLGDVAADVIGALHRSEDVDPVALSDWFGNASVKDGFDMIVALAAASSSGLSEETAVKEQKKLYRERLQKLNLDLAPLSGFCNLLLRLHKAQQAIKRGTTPRITQGRVERQPGGKRFVEQCDRYVVGDVEVCPVEGVDTVLSLDAGHYCDYDAPAECLRLMGENPSQLLGRLVEVEYVHNDDARAALEAAGYPGRNHGHYCKSLKIID
jgi:hypothetical protein